MFKWRNFLKDAGISSEYCVIYEDIFEKNRIDEEMLPDLTKEYLNAMDIEAVGDVIKILKYSKIVCEKNRISKITGRDEQPKVVRKTSIPEPSKLVSAKIDLTTSAPKPRRVLPEHEGKYKISMPAGTTAKSRAILKMQSDKLEKKSVFDRLQEVEVSSTSPVTSSSQKGLKKSIFNRLGNYKELEMDKPSKSWPAAPRGIVKPSQRSSQIKTSFTKTTLQREVKPIRFKEDMPMETEKQVTFSPEVTLRVYEDESPSKSQKNSSVKSRLGGGNKLGLVKPIMKTSAPPRFSKMKSDMIKNESIHSRLSQKVPYHKSTNANKSVFKRLGA